MNLKILVVEDDGTTSCLISAALNSGGYEPIHADTGKKAISITATSNPALILLDLSLPDIDGITVLRSIREWSDVPIIIISARDAEDDKVSALDSGADDYITKPFGNNELLARIRAIIRLYNKGRVDLEKSKFKVDSFQIDYEKRTVTKKDSPVHLTPIEYKIAVLLSRNAGKVLTHDFIISHIWGPYESDSQVLRVNIANIRRKIEENPADPKYIKTEVGVGYRMTDGTE